MPRHGLVRSRRSAGIQGWSTLVYPSLFSYPFFSTSLKCMSIGEEKKSPCRGEGERKKGGGGRSASLSLRPLTTKTRPFTGGTATARPSPSCSSSSAFASLLDAIASSKGARFTTKHRGPTLSIPPASENTVPSNAFLEKRIHVVDEERHTGKASLSISSLPLTVSFVKKILLRVQEKKISWEDVPAEVKALELWKEGEFWMKNYFSPALRGKLRRSEGEEACVEDEEDKIVDRREQQEGTPPHSPLPALPIHTTSSSVPRRFSSFSCTSCDGSALPIPSGCQPSLPHDAPHRHGGTDGASGALADRGPSSSRAQSGRIEGIPLFASAAPTGTGKSLLTPLWILHAHWSGVEERLLRTLELLEKREEEERKEKGEKESAEQEIEGPNSIKKRKIMKEKDETNQNRIVRYGLDQKTTVTNVEGEGDQPLPITSLEAFVHAFKACSRICIVMTQPTRLACRALAQYMARVIAIQQLRRQRRSQKSDAGRKGNRKSGSSDDSSAAKTRDGNTQKGDNAAECSSALVAIEWLTHRILGEEDDLAGWSAHDGKRRNIQRRAVERRLGRRRGGRIGYAMSGNTSFSHDSTEIIFATTSYVLLSLAHSPVDPLSSFSPSSCLDSMKKEKERKGGMEQQDCNKRLSLSTTEESSFITSPHSFTAAPRFLRPTVLILDEAHGRQLDADLLLTWARVYRCLHVPYPNHSVSLSHQERRNDSKGMKHVQGERTEQKGRHLTKTEKEWNGTGKKKGERETVHGRGASPTGVGSIPPRAVVPLQSVAKGAREIQMGTSAAVSSFITSPLSPDREETCPKNHTKASLTLLRGGPHMNTNGLKFFVVLSATLSLSAIHRFFGSPLTVVPWKVEEEEIQEEDDAERKRSDGCIPLPSLEQRGKVSHINLLSSGTISYDIASHALQSSLFLLAQAPHRALAQEASHISVQQWPLKEGTGLPSPSSPKDPTPRAPSMKGLPSLRDLRWWKWGVEVQQREFLPALSSSSSFASFSSRFKVEEYFLEDLPEGLLRSPLLGFPSSSTAPTAVSSSSLGGTPQLFSMQGRREMSHLKHIFLPPRSSSESSSSLLWKHPRSSSSLHRLSSSYSLVPSRLLPAPLRLDPRHYKSVSNLILQLLEVIQWRWGEVGEEEKEKEEKKNRCPRHHNDHDRPPSSSLSAPPTLLVFLPGLPEIHQVTMMLEGSCTPEVAALGYPFSSPSTMAPAIRGEEEGEDMKKSEHLCTPSVKAAASEIIVLRYDKGERDVAFSVVSLHRSLAVSAHHYIKASEHLVLHTTREEELESHERKRVVKRGVERHDSHGCDAVSHDPVYRRGSSSPPSPLRLILATSVAESSLTISNLRMVVDLSLDRMFIADSSTGATRKETSLVSASSLLQRRGRVGRTCDGMVLHLTSKYFFFADEVHQHQEEVRRNEKKEIPSKKQAQTQKEGSETNAISFTIKGDQTSFDSPLSSSQTTSLFVAPKMVRYGFPSLPESAATILLRISSLFPSLTGVMLSALPAPPSLFALLAGKDELIERNLWRRKRSDTTGPCFFDTPQWYRFLADLQPPLSVPPLRSLPPCGSGENEGSTLDNSPENDTIHGPTFVAPLPSPMEPLTHRSTASISAPSHTPPHRVLYPSRPFSSLSPLPRHHVGASPSYSSLMTFKGMLVSSLPLPLSSALLVYHGIQFMCVEDAVLLACGMSVPGLLIAPRVIRTSSTATHPAGENRSHSRHVSPLFQGVPSPISNAMSSGASDSAHPPPSNTSFPTRLQESRVQSEGEARYRCSSMEGSEMDTPLYQFMARLRALRRLAGHDTPTPEMVEDEKNDEGNRKRERNYPSSSSSSSSSHLSEPLLLRDLLRGWYMCKTIEDGWSYLSEYQIHRGSLKQVDWSIYQCCTRLLQILPGRRKVKSRENTSEQRSSASSCGPSEKKVAVRACIASHLSNSFSSFPTVHHSSLKNGQEQGRHWVGQKSEREQEVEDTVQRAVPTTEEVEEEEDKHDVPEYLLSWLQEATQTHFGEQVPPAYLPALQASLYRLQHAARVRAVHFSSSLYGAVTHSFSLAATSSTAPIDGRYGGVGRSSPRLNLPQWYYPDQRYASIFQYHYLPRETTSNDRCRGRGGYADGRTGFPASRYERNQKFISSLPTSSCAILEPIHPRLMEDGLEERKQETTTNDGQRKEKEGTEMGAMGSFLCSLSSCSSPLSSSLSQRFPSVMYTGPQNSLSYHLGRVEDRLCAAFIASFAHFTLQGEDSGHRHHHRRIARNGSVLRGAADEACCMAVELQELPSPPPSRSVATTTTPLVATSLEGKNSSGSTSSSMAGKKSKIENIPSHSDGLSITSTTTLCMLSLLNALSIYFPRKKEMKHPAPVSSSSSVLERAVEDSYGRDRAAAYSKGSMKECGEGVGIDVVHVFHSPYFLPKHRSASDLESKRPGSVRLSLLAVFSRMSSSFGSLCSTRLAANKDATETSRCFSSHDAVDSAREEVLLAPRPLTSAEYSRCSPYTSSVGFSSLGGREALCGARSLSSSPPSWSTVRLTSLGLSLLWSTWSLLPALPVTLETVTTRSLSLTEDRLGSSTSTSDKGRPRPDSVAPSHLPSSHSSLLWNKEKKKEMKNAPLPTKVNSKPETAARFTEEKALKATGQINGESGSPIRYHSFATPLAMPSSSFSSLPPKVWKVRSSSYISHEKEEYRTKPVENGREQDEEDITVCWIDSSGGTASTCHSLCRRSLLPLGLEDFFPSSVPDEACLPTARELSIAEMEEEENRIRPSSSASSSTTFPCIREGVTVRSEKEEFATSTTAPAASLISETRITRNGTIRIVGQLQLEKRVCWKAQLPSLSAFYEDFLRFSMKKKWDTHRAHLSDQLATPSCMAPMSGAKLAEQPTLESLSESSSRLCDNSERTKGNRVVPSKKAIASSQPPPPGSYCPVCFTAFSHPTYFISHCRSPTHLSHLRRCVEYNITYADLLALQQQGRVAHSDTEGSATFPKNGNITATFSPVTSSLCGRAAREKNVVEKKTKITDKESKETIALASPTSSKEEKGKEGVRLSTTSASSVQDVLAHPPPRTIPLDGMAMLSSLLFPLRPTLPGQNNLPSNSHVVDASSSSLLSPSAWPSGMIATEAVSCFAHPHSFLNVLQWTDARHAPLAVAGGLRAVTRMGERGRKRSLHVERRETGCGNRRSKEQGSTTPRPTLLPSKVQEEVVVALAQESGTEVHFPSFAPLSLPLLSSSPSFPLLNAVISDHLPSSEEDTILQHGGGGEVEGVDEEDTSYLFNRYEEVIGWCAQHIWVLPFARPSLSSAPASRSFTGTASAAPSNMQEGTPSSTIEATTIHSPYPQAATLLSGNGLSSVFILAGYLAAATRHSPVALLYDGAHEWVFGCMLVHRGGVWQFPFPIPVRDGIESVLKKIAGGMGMWPGLLLSNEVHSSRQSMWRSGESGKDLHWCSLHRACCACHPLPHGPPGAELVKSRMGCLSQLETEEKRLREQAMKAACTTPTPLTSSFEGGPSTVKSSNEVGEKKYEESMKCHAFSDEKHSVVHSALLLVLHEYLWSSRSVIAMPEFLERVLAKLRRAKKTSSSLDPHFSNSCGCTSHTVQRGVEVQLLQGYLHTHYPGKTLVDVLRLVGCRFLLPSREMVEDRVEGTEEEGAEPIKSNEEESSSCTLPSSSFGFRLASPSMDFRFTLPSILPSRLPPEDFIERLEMEMLESIGKQEDKNHRN